MTSTRAPLRMTVMASGRPIASANISRCRSWAVDGLPAARAAGRRAAARRARPGCRGRPRRPAVRSPAEPLPHRGGQRRGRADQAEVGAAHPAVTHQGGDDPAGGGVHRDGKAEAHPGHGGVDAHQAAWLSASAPPELPGLRAASVWITSSTRRAAAPLRVGSDRPRALTTPAVTEPARPSGLPTATTSWPTTSSSASPSSAGAGWAAAAARRGRTGGRRRPW